MRLLVVSDTHGNTENVLECIEEDNDFDYILHLGDNTEDGLKLSDITGLKVIMVRGNCDCLDEMNPDEKILELEGKRIFMTHGHKYGVKRDIGAIFYRGKELDADIVLFGHTHIALSIEHEGIHIFNPGSTSAPRLGARPSLGILDISDGSLKKEIINL